MYFFSVLFFNKSIFMLKRFVKNAGVFKKSNFKNNFFISVCYQENEVFHKSFASLFQKRVEFELQNVQWTFVLQRPKQAQTKASRFFCFKRVFEGVADKVRWGNFSQVKKVPLLKMLVQLLPIKQLPSQKNEAALLFLFLF